MIKGYLIKQNKVVLITDIQDFNQYLPKNNHQEKFIWIDMIEPTKEEQDFIEKEFELKLPSKQEKEEIEISSRYWEEHDRIEINSFFAINMDKDSKNETISFIIYNKLLISVRTSNLTAFEEFNKKLLNSPKEFKSGFEIIISILDIRIDRDADIIEGLSKDITALRKSVLTETSNNNKELFQKISELEDFNMKVRENLNDKQRILSSFLKSTKFNSNLKEDILILLKDIKSLMEYTSFNFEQLDYLKNIFLGLLNIEQNKVIKIFTIVNVVFLPPTLIASIYGMNFKIMPELHWEYGYLISIVLMIISAILPVYIFKKKNLI
jgi:magnesium transporter